MEEEYEDEFGGSDIESVDESDESRSGGDDIESVDESRESVGGYNIEFVDELSECQQCSICLLAMRNPVQTPCGHRFCKSCLLKSLR